MTSYEYVVFEYLRRRVKAEYGDTLIGNVVNGRIILCADSSDEEEAKGVKALHCDVHPNTLETCGVVNIPIPTIVRYLQEENIHGRFIFDDGVYILIVSPNEV